MGENVPDRGVVFVATGAEKYLRLAVFAAESIRRTNPGIAVDLFTDAPHDLPIFDKIHVREDAWFRTKIDALIHSRFERTLYLDSDLIVLADIGDIFEVLDRFDVALAHEQSRNIYLAHIFYRKPIPAAFPQFNGGLMALRHSENTQKMLKDWSAAVRDHDIGRDQPSLRETLWDSDLRIATLPPEYNLMRYRFLREWIRRDAAPRIIHSPHLHGDFKRFRDVPEPLTELLGLRIASRIPLLLESDHALAGRRGNSHHKAPGHADQYFSLADQMGRLHWILPRIPRRLWLLLQRRVRRLYQKLLRQLSFPGQT